jgi:hypothetical protein
MHMGNPLRRRGHEVAQLNTSFRRFGMQHAYTVVLGASLRFRHSVPA